MCEIYVDNLTYTYPTGKASSLSGISFATRPGELVALIGANNSGKSTLCYALAGVIPHFYRGVLEGSVVVAGRTTTECGLGELAQTVGLVMQNSSSQLSGIRYTVFDEVAFGLENRGIGRSEIISRVETALSVTDLSDLGERSPYQLSGGQQQRLALASVLAVTPQVLVLDEPTTFLDPQGTRNVFEILLSLKEQGRTIIIAEQHLEWIAEYADRVMVLSGGRLAREGTPADILASPEIKEHGIDWMPYTVAGAMARDKGSVRGDRPLPITLQSAAQFFTRA